MLITFGLTFYKYTLIKFNFYMKLVLLLSAGFLLSSSIFGQNSHGLDPVITPSLMHKSSSAHLSMNKTTLCVDTLRYAQSKEQILGTNNFYTLDIWQSDAEAITMTYLLSGASYTINKIEFFAANNTTDGNASCTVNAAIYSVNASYVPTTLLGSGNVTITSTTAGYYYATLAAPVTVSGNYAIVIQPTSLNSVLDIYVNDAAPGQSYDEVLARAKSNFYVSSNGSYVNIPTYTSVFTGGPFNFEPAVAPVVSYTINTASSATPNPVCAGTPVNFTGTSTPAGVLTNRFTNYQIFRTFFGTSANDSTHVWDFDDAGTLAWINPSATHTYSTAGTYDVTYYTLAGFWNSCVDFSTTSLTVNALPAVTAGATSTSVCNGSSTTLNQGGASTYVWNNGLGAVTSPSVAPTTNTTYQVTGTDVNGCTGTASVAITVNPVVDATFSYPSSTVCLSSANITPTATNLGTFSATPAGLSFVSTATGEINIAGSAAGTYTVTNTTTGTCPDIKTATLTLTNAPSANFSYTNSAYCTADVDPSPNFGSGASAGSFSATPAGLSINTTNGLVDLSASSAGTYTITNNIPAGGGCPAASANTSITVGVTPTMNVLPNVTVCSGATVSAATITVNPGTASFGWTNNQTAVGLGANGAGSVPSFTATNAGASPITATVSYAAMNGTCPSANQSYTITINPNPNAMIAAVNPLCSNSSSVNLVATPPGGTFSGTGMTANIFDPAVGAGSYTITYLVTDANNCTGTATTTITVNAEPTVTLGTFAAVCLQSPAFALSGGLPAGGSYTGTGVSSGNFSPATAGVGSQNIVYNYIDANGCSSAASQTINVQDCAGVEENKAVVLMIAPNPASETILLSSNEEVQVNLVTMDGKLVIVGKQLSPNTPTTIDVATFARGVYYLQIVGKKENSIHQIVLQ